MYIGQNEITLVELYRIFPGLRAWRTEHLSSLSWKYLTLRLELEFV